MNFTERDVLAVQADAFERARELVCRLLSHKPVVTQADVMAIGNPYDGLNGYHRGAPKTREDGRCECQGGAFTIVGCPYCVESR